MDKAKEHHSAGRELDERGRGEMKWRGDVLGHTS